MKPPKGETSAAFRPLYFVPILKSLPSENWGEAGLYTTLQLLEIALPFLRRGASHPNPLRSRLLGPGIWDGNYFVNAKLLKTSSVSLQSLSVSLMG